jgi:hypothetical protein
MTLISQPYCYHPYVYFGASVLQLGMAPLHCAVKDGNVEMTTLLLERGANIKAKNKVCGMNLYRLSVRAFRVQSYL